MIFRGFQGGFQIQKLKMWVKSNNRFRVKLVLLAILLSQPLKTWGEEELMPLLFEMHLKLVFLFKPYNQRPYNVPMRTMSELNKISHLPPSQNYFNLYQNLEKQNEKLIEDHKFMKYQDMHMVDIARTSGFVHHPSRETNSIVEGEIFRNEQDKIVESMRLMMAEYCVQKGIWKSLDEAFSGFDENQKKKYRMLHRE